MGYFLRYPQIEYFGHSIKDITLRFTFFTKLLENTSAFEPYRVKNGDRIEDIANKIYGNSELHWIIMISNNIVDPFYDWPLNDIELTEYTNDKYVNPNDVHHYEDGSGRIVTENAGGAIPITNLEYEAVENERFREISLLKPKYVAKVVSEFENLLGQL